MITLNHSKTTIIPIHLPDLQFIRYCEKEHHINRGIYNTIDEWLFNYGIKNVLDRRQIIICFLQFLNEIRMENNTAKVRIGSGGLTNLLTKFCSNNINLK